MAVAVTSFYERLWQFIRGDLPVPDFESWIYADEAAESHLGADLHLEVISTDFRSRDAVHGLRERLREHARSACPRSCRCLEQRDLAVVPMGSEYHDVLGTIDAIEQRGRPWWWLWLGRCRECQQWWLVAQEERQNDLFCMRRLSEPEAAAIVDERQWPPELDTYEALLEIGLAAGHRVSFVDPLGSFSLADTIEDLARNRPGIHVSEIARLLNLKTDLALTLARRVVAKTGVSIRLA